MLNQYSMVLKRSDFMNYAECPRSYAQHKQ